MVYDEGFDIVFNKNKHDYRSYFIFLKYGLNNNFKNVNSKWASYCYTTLIGWYHVGDEWGCFYGSKKGTNHDEVTNGEAPKKMVVVEGSMKEKVFLENKENIQNEQRFMDMELQTKFSTRLTVTSQFKEHSKVVERINEMDLTWKATNYAEFENMTVEQLNKYAGRSKTKNFSDINNLHTSEKKSSSNSNRRLYSHSLSKKNFLKHKSHNKSQSIPLNFDWKDYMSEPKSQVKLIYFIIIL